MIYQLPHTPKPPTMSKRRESHAIHTAHPVRHILSETVTFKEAGAPDAAFYNFLATIGKGE